MLEGEQRRQQILQELQGAKKTISASRFAKDFGVSRQSIVGDVALLRAAGEDIIATARGYKLNAVVAEKGLLAKIAVQHGEDQTEEELATIIEHGAEVIDVIVEHELYGELVGGLYIATPEQIQSFMKKYRSSNSRLLSQLTNGIHLHTIRYQNEASLAKIKEALANKGILYQGND
ncbi:MAG: transcription repressor NadR [Enterococcus sp.]|nr:transcription repressor NadR [Enterococcus sp.]